MKPPAFGYSRPESAEQAVALLGSLGSDGKVLAGGQSLIPLLNLRLAAPGHLVDINGLAELAYVRVGGGEVAIGALARHAEVLRDTAAGAAAPLLAMALAHVAHPAIRNRGTTVGSIVHADPASEMPAVLALLGGTVRLASAGGERVVGADDFFLGPFEPDVRPDELATEVVVPELPVRTGCAFAEVSRRRGDYAVCGTAAMVTLGSDGGVTSAKAAYLSVGPVPVVLDLTEAARDPRQAGRLAMARLDPAGDLHATAAYRRHLAGVLTERALTGALAHARERSDG